MANITLADMKVGDILMCKSQGTSTHNVIGFGENLATGRDYRNYIHAAIITAEGAGVTLVESHGEGITATTPPGSPATVFRLKPEVSDAEALALAAAAVARELMGRYQKANDSFGQYSRAKATFSLLRTRGSSDNTRAVVKEISDGTYTGGIFCSMFVVICYQVAILRMNKPAKLLPLDVDAQSMQPSFMTGYLKQNTQQWAEIGEFAPA